MTQMQTIDPNRGTGRTTRQLVSLLRQAFAQAAQSPSGQVTAVFVLGRSREFVHTADLIRDSETFRRLRVRVVSYERRNPVLALALEGVPDLRVDLRFVTAAAWPEAQHSFRRDTPYAIDHAAYRK